MDKTMDWARLVELAGAAGSIAFGGGGVQRKPMTAARRIAASAIGPRTVVSMLGGPETDLLIGAGKVDRLLFAFVGFDAYGLAPNFRAARESAALEVVEYSEGTMLAAYDAGARALPFLPTRFGLGTAITRTPNAPFREFDCPLTGERLLAVPALEPDLAVVHVNVADRAGNALIHGDAYADPLLVRAARRTVLTAERVVDALPRELPPEAGGRSTFVSRLWVHGVIEAPGGAGMTAMFPDYPLDLEAVMRYQRMAADADWLRTFVAAED